MRIDHSHGHQIAGIGDAVHAHAAVVVGHVFDQPVDGVVGVGAFVHAVGVRSGMQHFEFAFGAVAAANVLKDEDVAVGKHFRVAEEMAAHAFIGGYIFVFQ